MPKNFDLIPAEDYSRVADIAVINIGGTASKVWDPNLERLYFDGISRAETWLENTGFEGVARLASPFLLDSLDMKQGHHTQAARLVAEVPERRVGVIMGTSRNIRFAQRLSRIRIGGKSVEDVKHVDLTGGMYPESFKYSDFPGNLSQTVEDLMHDEEPTPEGLVARNGIFIVLSARVLPWRNAVKDTTYQPPRMTTREEKLKRAKFLAVARRKAASITNDQGIVHQHTKSA